LFSPFKHKRTIAIFVLALIGCFSSSQHANTVSNVVLGGQASGFAALSGGNPANCSLVSAPGITDATTAFVATNAPDPFTDTINFGTLTNGNGTNSVATVAMRQRGNITCHVSCSVSSFTATNISYGGTTLVSGTGSQLGFISLGSAAVTNGPQGNTTGFSYGGRFTSGTDTLATLNGGVVAAVNGSHDRFVSFTVQPSNNGTQVSPNNWVQDAVVFRIPTGMGWAPVAGGPSNFSINVQFGIFALP
jgi:hypothetical protein